MTPTQFGRLAERLARFFGTPRYIVGQTILVDHLDRPQRGRGLAAV